MLELDQHCPQATSAAVDVEGLASFAQRALDILQKRTDKCALTLGLDGIRPRAMVLR